MQLSDKSIVSYKATQSYLFDLCHQHLLQFTNNKVQIQSKNSFRAIFTEVDKSCPGMCLNPRICIVVHY